MWAILKFLTDFENCDRAWNFWLILKFLTNFEFFNQFCNFWPILNFFSNFEIFDEFWNFWQILKFWNNFEILHQFLNFWPILKYLTNFLSHWQISDHFIRIFWTFEIFVQYLLKLAVLNFSRFILPCMYFLFQNFKKIRL